VTVRASGSPQDVFARERQEHIARIVEEHGRARVADLAARFDVSAVTIRKDLVLLEAERRLVRTHGGAIVIDRSRPELSFEIRERLQADEKQRIGAAAAALVHDGESIVMDASTTALAVARHLKSRQGWSQLTVITNGLRLASDLAGHPGITVLMLGGRVRWEALSVVGQLGEGLFSRINVQKAFLGAAGFTVESGLADATDEEAQIKRSMVSAASEVIAIVDTTKWERAAFATFCPTDRISQVLTDDGASPAMVADLRARGVDVRLVGPGGAAEPRQPADPAARDGRDATGSAR
jgi:DeoR/GlpR family transcriptional regulator of sugar metabolism